MSLCQVATIVSKAMRDEGYKRPAPFPYKETTYSLFHALMDKTTHRMDENSKVIVVDGPIGVGRDEFAKVRKNFKCALSDFSSFFKSILKG